MYQACINNGESDLTDNEAWIKQLFDFTTIEEVMNFKIKDKVKIDFKIDKAYAFSANGKLISSPFRSKNV